MAFAVVFQALVYMMMMMMIITMMIMMMMMMVMMMTYSTSTKAVNIYLPMSSQIGVDPGIKVKRSKLA